MESTKTTPQTDAVTLGIYIPTYNRVCYLDNLPGELAIQIGGLRHGYELLIGDNCSSGTIEQVTVRCQDKLNVQCLRRPSNLDSAENLNQLCRGAQGKYVLYHADDDLPILVGIDKGLKIFKHNAAVSVIFAPWFIYDLPTRQNITSFYRQGNSYLIEQHDYVKPLALILSHHIFPGIYLARREVLDRLYFAAPGHTFWAFAHTAGMLGSYVLYFSKAPFYCSVARYFDDETRTQAGNEEVEYAWDRYRGGLEYMLSKFVPTLAPNER